MRQIAIRETLISLNSKLACTPLSRHVQLHVRPRRRWRFEPRQGRRVKLAFRHWPVRWKMLSLGAAASALPLAVTTVLAYRSGSALIRRSAISLLEARADELAGDLDEFHTGFRRAAARLSALPAVKEFCALDPAGRANAEAKTEAWLGAYAAADPQRTHLVALFDREGTITAATITGIRGKNYGYRRYFQSALAGEPTISELFISAAEAGGIPTIAYAAPIRNAAGEVMCVSLLVARGQQFWDAVAEKKGAAGPGSYAVVYDQYGISIAP